MSCGQCAHRNALHKSCGHALHALHVLFAFVAVATMGGAVYGWPSMRRVLLREGTLDTCATDSVEPCTKEELAFGLIFTMGAAANQGGRLVIGIFLDRFGPRRTAPLCSLMVAAGALTFGFASSTAAFAVGLVCIGMGGAGTQLSVQSVSALFPRHRSLVMASLSGAFQLASGIFLVFELLDEKGIAGRRGLLCGYAVLVASIAAAAAAVLPRGPFGTPPRSTMTQEKDVAHSAKSVAAVVVSMPGPACTGAIVPLRSRTFRGQALSAEFLLLVAFFTGNALQAQFTVASIGTQLELKGDTGGELTRFFSSTLALTFLATPLIGHAFDRFGFPRVMAAVNSANMAVPLFLLLPSLHAQYATCFAYGLGRVALWATFFAYTGATFGFAHFGKLAGSGLVFQATVSLLQYPLLDVTLGPLGNDFTFVNCLFAAISLSLYVVPLALWWRSRSRPPPPPVHQDQDPAGVSTTA